MDYNIIEQHGELTLRNHPDNDAQSQFSVYAGEFHLESFRNVSHAIYLYNAISSILPKEK